MVEPNVKDGKGGLRDLNTLFWIAQYLHPRRAASSGCCSWTCSSAREVRAFIRAFDFLWAVRCHLHFATGRPEERLTFDLQPEIARRMGYGDRGDAPAVERFMRRYFLIAKEVGALTRVFAAKLEAERVKTRAQGPVAPDPRPQRASASRWTSRASIEEGGRLNVDGPEIFERDPVQPAAAVRIADQRDLDLHPDAFTAATRGRST